MLHRNRNRKQGVGKVLSLVRSGPTVIKIWAHGDPRALTDSIGKISHNKASTPMESYCNATEGDTLTLFFAEGREAPSIYQTTLPPTTVLCDIIKRGLCGEVLDIEITPPNIFMRLIGGHIDRAIDRIAQDFGAREAAGNESMDYMDEEAVLLNFTSAPLNQIVPLDEFHPRALLIDKPYGQLMVYLRAKAQEYLNVAMGGPDWNEINITMFDAMDQFNLHYQRLISVLQGLDMGIVSGESWEPEYTIALRKSEVYQVRLLTPFGGQELKQICLGLEYDEKSNRVVDFDVYFEKKKIGWASEKKMNFPKLTRPEIGMTYRKKLLARLPSEARAFLASLDRKIDRKNNPRSGNT